MSDTAAFDKRAWLPEQSRRAVYRPQGERAKVQGAQTHVDRGLRETSQFFHLESYLADHAKYFPKNRANYFPKSQIFKLSLA
jgi:hypothetical protein